MKLIQYLWCLARRDFDKFPYASILDLKSNLTLRFTVYCLGFKCYVATTARLHRPWGQASLVPGMLRYVDVVIKSRYVDIVITFAGAAFSGACVQAAVPYLAAGSTTTANWGQS